MTIAEIAQEFARKAERARRVSSQIEAQREAEMAAMESLCRFFTGGLPWIQCKDGSFRLFEGAWA